MTTKKYELGDVTPANILQIRVLNVNTLPVRYSDKFYRELLTNYGNDYMQYAFWNGFVVGGISARVETDAETSVKKLYIMTLNVLAAYRRKGIATSLLHHILEKASKDASISEIYLHVQTSNDEAKNFYLSQGFEERGIIENYYTNIDPPDCFILAKTNTPQQQS